MRVLEALASLAFRRAKLIVAFSVGFFAFAGVVGSGVADRLDPYGSDDPGTESFQGTQRLEEAGYREPAVVILVGGIHPTSTRGRERVGRLAHRVSSDHDVAAVAGFHTRGSRMFLSRDGDATYLAVRLIPTDDGREQDAAQRIVGLLKGQPGVKVGGPALVQSQANDQTERDLRRAELYAAPILFALSLLFFRSLVAALLPLLVGGFAIVGTLLMLRVASEFTSVSIFALNLVTGLALGLAIDYCLFIIARYREEIARSGPGLLAMRATMLTAGRTVLFSSLTVAAALAALLLFPQNFLYSMGLGGSLVTLIAAGIALLVLPAILCLLGDRVNAGAPAVLRRRAEREARPMSTGLWFRLSRVVMRAPGEIATVCVAGLIALGIAAGGVHFTSIDAQVLPQSASARQVDDVLRADFPRFGDTPIELVVGNGRYEASGVVKAARRLRGVSAVGAPIELKKRLMAIEVISNRPPLSTSSQDLVKALRRIDGHILVTGVTAGHLDLQDSLAAHLPPVLAIVAASTFVVMFLMTGSVILPLKQLLMNVLGLGAVFGTLVLVFQDGRLEHLLSYQSQGGLESTQLLLLFAVAFGLSTDYGVFLLSRIKEARDHGASDAAAVAIGLERTGRVVTAAALLFCVAVGSFVTSEMIFIKQVGFGTALAVLVDATVIRGLLVPSLMMLLGRWNWWAPRPMRRLHERIGVSDASG